jgi:hypothetical protein
LKGLAETIGSQHAPVVHSVWLTIPQQMFCTEGESICIPFPWLGDLQKPPMVVTDSSEGVLIQTMVECPITHFLLQNLGKLMFMLPLYHDSGMI